MFNLNVEEIKLIDSFLVLKESDEQEFVCDYETVFSKNCNGICGGISNKK